VNQRWRTALAVIILGALLFFCALLAPAYWRNWQFTGELDSVCRARAASQVAPEVVRAQVQDRAARMGIPLQHGEIRVTGPAGGHLEIEVLYIVRVDLGIYTADLHFRPRVRE
jgi:hypothetical protein